MSSPLFHKLDTIPSLDWTTQTQHGIITPDLDKPNGICLQALVPAILVRHIIIHTLHTASQCLMFFSISILVLWPYFSNHTATSCLAEYQKSGRRIPRHHCLDSCRRSLALTIMLWHQSITHLPRLLRIPHRRRNEYKTRSYELVQTASRVRPGATSRVSCESWNDDACELERLARTVILEKFGVALLSCLLTVEYDSSAVV